MLEESDVDPMDSKMNKRSIWGNDRRENRVDEGGERERQLRFFGHVMGIKVMENLIMTGTVEGRRWKRRPKEKCIDGLVKLVYPGCPRQMAGSTWLPTS